MGIFQHQLIQWFTNLLHLHLLLSQLQRRLPTGLLGLLMRTLPINLTLANPPPQMSECSLFPRRPPHHYPTSLTPSMLPFLFPLLLHPALHSTLPPSHPWLVELLRRQRGLQPATEHLCVEPATTSSGKITLTMFNVHPSQITKPLVICVFIQQPINLPTLGTFMSQRLINASTVQDSVCIKTPNTFLLQLQKHPTSLVSLYLFIFCKGCLTLLARSLCKHWVGASAAM